ncbi:MAG: hypothetical protein ABIO04_13115 [Ferruginibacter sp.]
MKQNKDKNKGKLKTESVEDLKKQTVSDDDVKKGYNEKNPTQAQGAFKPDVASKKN